ncbi:uncharacterized protein LOC130656366 isoform X2 [Hydractinia symbiolongicarpus]|uniref:uncharacterized protein LOC130656366 isoform X2 n=1 Tax=Hydractinia symbiolongicarpus TaxID=13093 RepID=UPI00254DD845|nr:uncharacterized protein LOC130656366 isoform X2 [Hydractinia symbiolongicarpus]
MFTYLNFALAVVCIALFWLLIKIRKIYSKLYKKNTRIPDVNILKKIIPPSGEIGWDIFTVCNGVPIWRYKGTFTFAPYSIVACRALLQEKSSSVLQELINIKTFSALFPEYPALEIEESSTTGNRDVVSLSNVNTSLSLTSIVTCHLSHISFNLERFWFNGPTMSWLYLCPTSMLLSEQYGYWIIFVLQDLNDGNGSMLYILGSFPSSVHFARISHMLSSCLVLTREHMDSLYLSKLLPKKKKHDGKESKQKKEIKSRTPSPKPIKASVNQASPVIKPKPKNASILRNEAVGYIEEPAVIKRIASTECIPSKSTVEANSTPSNAVGEEALISKTLPIKDDLPNNEEAAVPNDEVNKKLLKYKDVLDEGYGMLISAHEADENTPGWAYVGLKDDVQIYRKDPDELSASSCYKGTTEIKVPLEYLFNYILDLEFKKEYDNLFDQGEDVELIGDGLTKIVHLQYQNVWPTTGRDFCSISAFRHIKDNLYGIMVKAVTHAECPPIKNKVRGEVLIGGFMVEVISSDPPRNRLTYVTRADLHGSIPQRIINRVSAEQPLFAASIRKHVERRYEIQDPEESKSNWLEKLHSAPSIIEKIAVPMVNTATAIFKDENNSETDGSPELPVKNQLEKDGDNDILLKEEKSENATDVSDTQTDPNEINTTDIGEDDSHVLTSSGFNIKENYYSPVNEELVLPPRITDEDSLINDTESIGDLSQFTEDLQPQISVSEQELDLPRDETGQIDFVTLGNQTAASLEEEFLATRYIQPSTVVDITNSPNDTWVYQGTTKDVLIMRKIHSNQKYHSFLGRGIINVLPVTVWEAIRNPTTRFIYDNMLKRNTVIKEISERHRIVHMRHETHACFVKQARDFCVLTVERVEQQRYVLGAVSVDIPECPPVRDCVRGKVISSGWIVEPIYLNGKSCSRVTYISQVDFGGRLPARLINFIAKRQPLALSYLRDYLESAEM